MVLEPVPVRVTESPLGRTTLLASRRVTVMVAVVLPSATTEPKLVDMLDWAVVVGPE